MRFVVLLLFSFATHGDDTVWRAKMQNVSVALGAVVPYLYPNPEKDVKNLTEKLRVLFEASQRLDLNRDHIIKTGDSDPGLAFVFRSFQDDVARAYFSARDGYTQYAQYVIGNTAAYCVACHTRAPTNEQFPVLKSFDESLKSAPWITQIQFQSAARQFDEVYARVIERLQSSKGQPASTLDLERAARLALSISIRVKEDPKAALKLAKAVQNSKHANYPMKHSAIEWEKEVRSWMKEKRRDLFSAPQMLDEGRRLVAKAEDSKTHGPDEVNYLRATQVLHRLLRTFPESPEVPESLYLIGQAYMPLQELGLWNLQEKYFEACIYRAPHTELAERCYKRFERSVVFGYSGSSGVHIPGDVSQQLHHLKAQAERVKELL